MTRYTVERRTRIGVANFKTSSQIMSEEEVKMSFPTWEGQPFHKVGNTYFLIKKIDNQS